jgi:hypothetical protein
MKQHDVNENELKELKGYLFKKSPRFFAGWQVNIGFKLYMFSSIE